MDPVTLTAIIGAGLGFLGTRASNAAAAREAQRNRDFQERMSSTAHVREVRDLQKAGLHPMLSAHGSGASSPSGAVAEVRDPTEGTARGIAAALSLKQMAAQVSLTEAQAENVRAQTGDLHSQAASGRYAEIANRVHLQDLSIQQAKHLLPVVVAQAKAELRLTEGNVRAVKASAILDELLTQGAVNEAEFQKMIGQGGKWLKLVGELRNVLKGGSGGR